MKNVTGDTFQLVENKISVESDIYSSLRVQFDLPNRASGFAQHGLVGYRQELFNTGSQVILYYQ